MFSLTRREQVVVALLVASLVIGGAISLWDRFSPDTIQDFQVIRVVKPPEPASEDVEPTEPAGAAYASKKVNLNTAAARELERLPRIGPKTAHRILLWRDKNGPFRTLNDLAEISGIGEKTIAEINDLVEF